LVAHLLSRIVVDARFAFIGSAAPPRPRPADTTSLAEPAASPC
jgi:hypothetical protein